MDQLLLALVRKELTGEEAAEAKWWTTELNFRTMDACLQLHGGYGYMEEYSIARHWRDSRVMRIGGGTTEIMKEIIGRRMLGV
jgi:acyl-CoA dehydrogenase